jgi:imidazolonepropionase-like amidohydrolase
MQRSLTHLAQRLGLATASLALAGTSIAAPTAGPTTVADKYAIKAGTVITMAGDPIPNGVIVITDGRISAVGSADDVQIPWDAEVLDVPHLTAFPGFVEACTSQGMDRPNESIDITPFLDVRDSVDPVKFFFEDARRWGITTLNVQQGNETVISGMGMIVRPRGMTVEAMMVRPQSGVKISMAPKRSKSRATQAMVLRDAFANCRRYLEQVVQEKRDGNDRARREALAQGRDLTGDNGKGRAMEGSAWKVEGLELVPRGEIDEKQAPLLAIVEGRLPVTLNCTTPMDVIRGIEIARENGFLGNMTILMTANCHKAADAIAKAGVPVILTGNLMHTETDPVTEDETETFAPKVMKDKGITFALTGNSGATQELWVSAAVCVGQGLDRADALAAVTTVPAKLLGLDEHVGSIAKGRDGNVLLFTGDPLSAASQIEYVVLEGEMLYDRSKDSRLRHLIDGDAAPGTAPAEEEPATDIHEEERRQGAGEGR